MLFVPVDPRWKRAKERAIKQKIQSSKLLFPTELQTDGVDVYLVQSSRNDGSWYVVELHKNVVSSNVVCSCPAGKQAVPCKHAALALIRSGRYAEPIEVPETEKVAA